MAGRLPSGGTGSRWGAARLPTAFLLLNGLLLAPGWIVAGRVGPEWIALEAAAIAGVFALVPRRRWTVWLSWATALLIVLLTVVATGNAATRLSLGRPLNLLLDLYLLEAVYHLLSGVLGRAGGTLALAGLAAAGAALVWALAKLLSPQEGGAAGSRASVGIAVLAAGLAVGVAARGLPSLGERSALPAADLVVGQIERFKHTAAERDRFAGELDGAPAETADRPGLLESLAGTDVLLAFLESYGMAAIEDPRYGAVLVPRLREVEKRLEAAGLGLVTGALVAPIQGGQSWLAHGTVLSGLRIDNQLRYDLLVASGREGLVHDFGHAGYRTAAVMPAITMPWPEGERFGYDEIFVERNMGYTGPSLNWVTIPDQYTWWFLERDVRRKEEVPLFAVLALISSHAPWTPVLPVLEDWESLGHGSVFAPWEDAGTPPEELWRDTDRVREHYALSVDYAVHAMAAYAERHVDDRTLLVALGDHQPAPLITGEDATHAVPVHVISGDPALLRPFLQIGFRRGGLPDPETPSMGMDEFRGWFVRAFSERPVNPETP